MAYSPDLTAYWNWGRPGNDTLDPDDVGLGPKLTIVRNSPAQYYDAAGIVQTAVAAPDTVTDQDAATRIDHDPSTLARRGLLVEEARGNYVLWSDQLDNAGWTRFGSSVDGTKVTGPDGLLSGQLVRDTTENSNHGLFQQTIEGGSVVAASVYAKAVPGSAYTTLVLQAATTGDSIRLGVNFDVGNGTVGASEILGDGTIDQTGIIALPNGWYRCWFTGTFNTGNFGRIRLYNGDSVAGPSLTSNGIYWWQAQLESNASPTSGVVTTNALVVRQADVVQTTDATWFSAGPGTWYSSIIGFSYDPAASSATGTIWSFRDSAVPIGREIFAHYNRSGANVEGARLVVTDGTIQRYDEIIAGDYCDGSEQDVAFGYENGGQYRHYWNGNPSTSVAGGPAPSQGNLLEFNAQAGSNTTPGLWIQQFRWYNTRRPDNETVGTPGDGTGGLLQLSNGDLPEDPGVAPTGNPYVMMI